MARSWPASSLALHEVEKPHQQTRNGRVAGGVGGFEDHRQQASDEPRVGGGGLRGQPRTARHLLAQGRQRSQPVQHIGDARKQPRALAQLRGLGVQLVKVLAQRMFGVCRLRHLRQTLGTKTLPGRTQVQVAHATLALQLVHQACARIHQFGGERELLQLGDFAAFGGEQEMESGFHVPVAAAISVPSGLLHWDHVDPRNRILL